MGVEPMCLTYKLSDKAVKELFRKAEDFGATRRVVFNLGDLTPEARQAWLEMFGTDKDAELREFYIGGGEVYRDGSVSDRPPMLEHMFGDWLKQDNLLTPETVSDAVLALHQQFRMIKTKLEAYKPKWEKALKAYQERKAAEAKERAKAKAEAKAKREVMAKTLIQPWVEEIARLADLANRKAMVIKVFHALTGVEEDPSVKGFSFAIFEEIVDPEHGVSCEFTVKSTREPPSGMHVGDRVVIYPRAVANQAFINVAKKLLKSASILADFYERDRETCHNCGDVAEVEYGLWIANGHVRVYVVEEYPCSCGYDC